MRERLIGDEFDYDGSRYVVCEGGDGCGGCSFVFQKCNLLYNMLGNCLGIFREDGKDVVFKRKGGNDGI